MVLLVVNLVMISAAVAFAAVLIGMWMLLSMLWDWVWNG